jgi:hypothetical protein
MHERIEEIVASAHGKATDSLNHLSTATDMLRELESDSPSPDIFCAASSLRKRMGTVLMMGTSATILSTFTTLLDSAKSAAASKDDPEAQKIRTTAMASLDSARSLHKTYLTEFDPILKTIVATVSSAPAPPAAAHPAAGPASGAASATPAPATAAAAPDAAHGPGSDTPGNDEDNMET